LEAAVRVRDVMSSPVVCVPPDMRLKEVADLLVTRAISAVPVVEDGELVGIVSEADLVPLELAPDLEPTSSRRPMHPATFRRWPPRR
jgi:predicted transcriptional regulator